jgi:hypothetical protein
MFAITKSLQASLVKRCPMDETTQEVADRRGRVLSASRQAPDFALCNHLIFLSLHFKRLNDVCSHRHARVVQTKVI